MGATLEATLVDARSTMMVSMALVQALVDRIWTTQLGGPAPVTILTTLTDGLHRMIAWMILCTGAAGLCGELPNFLCQKKGCLSCWMQCWMQCCRVGFLSRLCGVAVPFQA